jgi:hypothetical protein
MTDKPPFVKVQKPAFVNKEFFTVKRIGVICILVGLGIAAVAGGLLGVIGVAASLMGYYIITHEARILEQAKR